MKILNVKKTERYLIIVTDEGDRKIRLDYENIQEVERKCFEFKGRECLVKTSTINQWNPDEWFSDVWELNSESQERGPINSHGQSENFSLLVSGCFTGVQ